MLQRSVAGCISLVYKLQVVIGPLLGARVAWRQRLFLCQIKKTDILKKLRTMIFSVLARYYILDSAFLFRLSHGCNLETQRSLARHQQKLQIFRLCAEFRGERCGLYKLVCNFVARGQTGVDVPTPVFSGWYLFINENGCRKWWVYLSGLSPCCVHLIQG